jgi:phage terminase large subunit-like protein
MPWQRHVVDVALEINPRSHPDRPGLLRYRDVVLSVPRQSGKTTLIMALALHRALAFKQAQTIVYAAQTRKDARLKLLDDQWPIIQNSPFADLADIRLANGEESIRWKNGSRHGLVANTEKAGHGQTIDLGFVDEAFSQVDDRLEQAFSPAMITRAEPQQWVVSTMGTDASTFLNRKVRQGRQLVDQPDSLTAYFEWSLDPDADPTDESLWPTFMPALGHTITVEAIRGELFKFRDNMGEFKRAYGNIPTAQLEDTVFDLATWATLGDADAAARSLFNKTLAVDMDPERTTCTLVMAGVRDTDQLLQVEVVDQVVPTRAPERIVDLVRRYQLKHVVIDPMGPANALIGLLERENIKCMLVSSRDMSMACGGLYDLVQGEKVRHLPDQALTDAIMGAKRRRLGDGWALDRRSSSVNISPLVAAALSLWACSTTKPDVQPSVFFLSDFIDTDDDDDADLEEAM